MTPRVPSTHSRRRFLTAATTGLFAAAAIAASCTSRGCAPKQTKTTNPLSTFGYVDRAGWILTVDDNRKLGPVTAAETR